MLKTSSLLEAVALVGLGIIIESPEKRKTIIGALDRTGTMIEKTIKDFAKGSMVNNMPITIDNEDEA